MSYKVLFYSPKSGHRWIEAGQQFRLLPDEKQVLTDSGHAIVAKDDTEAKLEEAIQREGIKWGDLIESVTKAVGLKPCGKCAQRKQVLNYVRQNGVLETLRRLKEIGL